MNLYIVRHGQTNVNAEHRAQGRRNGKPLNEVGIQQANELRKKFEEEQIAFDYIYSSPQESKAFEIIKECADEGHIAAIYDLGANFFFNGNGTDVNYELADSYLNIAKENGLKRAIDLYDSRNKMKK